MADFIAVIRRAVDGLTENTPEMRVKVYERARGAVQRQLENMKPRPPEAMLQRQLEKLDAAIREVEAEHSEALAADDTVSAAPYVAEVHEEPVHEALHEQPAPVEETVAEQPSAYEEPQDAYQQEVRTEHAAPEIEAEEPVAETAPWQQPIDEAPAEEWRAPQQETPAFYEEVAAHEHSIEQPVAVEPEPIAEVEPVRASDYNPANRLVEPFAPFERPQEFVEHSQEEPLQSEAVARFDPVWNEPVAETQAEPPKDAETVWADQEIHSFSGLAPVAESADSGARAFEEAISGLQTMPEPAKMPAANEGFSWESAAFDDLPPIEAAPEKKPAAAASSFDDSDLFSEIHGNKPAAAPPADVPGEEWKEAESLRGYGRRGVATDDDDTAPAADIDQIVAAKLQNKNFRMEPKPRRFGLGKVIGAIIVLAILGGGAYAAWMNREELTAMVNGLVSSAPKTAETQPAATTETAPASTPAASNTAPAAPAQNNQQVASLDDGSSTGNKFTQRLMPDGTENDNGPATAPVTPTAEGKSVAEQNVASATTPAVQAAAPAGQANAAPVEAPGSPAAASTPPATATPPTTPMGSTEKMFLYEERIGQSSPTAIQGSVAWSLQKEEGPSGKQESTVQANITVPERNFSALVTFKRNADASLPASHLVEIVFSLPPNFEGGSIDSVQRISMKRTEQDRGDALIAVPAKITDDFHMIALNDYPDARKSNLDLMATRDWIDIPITYRNGRRALITMQKGSTGAEAFTTAIREWTALGDVSTSQ